MITLITGGSGKSAYAEKYICHVSNENGYKEKYYIATMQVFDDEGQRKIDRHRRLRAGKGFITIEQPRDIKKAVEKLQSENCLKNGRSALLECMSNLVANVAELVIVTNNVFEDGVCYDESTMNYIKAMGIVNRGLAAMAERVVEVVAGIPVAVK